MRTFTPLFALWRSVLISSSSVIWYHRISMLYFASSSRCKMGWCAHQGEINNVQVSNSYGLEVTTSGADDTHERMLIFPDVLRYITHPIKNKGPINCFRCIFIKTCKGELCPSFLLFLYGVDSITIYRNSLVVCKMNESISLFNYNMSFVMRFWSCYGEYTTGL